jgi:hypothetical protein
MIHHEQYTIPSESRPNTGYVVADAGGRWVCSCPGFTYHGHCKHAAKMELHFGSQLFAGLTKSFGGSG